MNDVMQVILAILKMTTIESTLRVLSIIIKIMLII